jgi:asparagine synthase (glutamine-hydrolysing)
MCGICGIYNHEQDKPVSTRLVRRMMTTMRHRGPDDEGIHLESNVGLGFRRLSIIDLSEGHQPMSDPSRKVWVVFNGEIYNFKQLRSELESHGRRFRTNSDTEVIVHGYLQWGDEVLQRMNGMFGLGIWDSMQKRLILARDAMGIKPMYFSRDEDRLVFGSEIRPILAARQRSREVDALAVNLFLRYRYTPAPYTLYQGISKLAAGTMLIAHAGSIEIKRWYNYEPQLFERMPSMEEATETLLHLYKQAVKRQLVSDVPLGLLLSGGIDSGLLLGLMDEFGRRWPTFTVGYGAGYADDELCDALQTAEIYGSRHAQVRLDRPTFERKLADIIERLEEPVASSSIVPMYFVCQRASRDVRVALIGQGPDELFGGYTRHLGVRYGSLWRMLPQPFRSLLSTGARALPRGEFISRGIASLGTRGRLKRYRDVFSLLPGPRIDGLFKEGLIELDAGAVVLDCWADSEEIINQLDELGGFQFLELRSSLPDELLMYGDKMSMAHGLEVRVPYLDREIVEYSQKLSQSFKVQKGIRKYLHKQVCRRFLPEIILSRRKRGFAVNVVDEWFTDSIYSVMSEAIKDPSSQMYEFFDYDIVKGLYNEHTARKSDNHKILFSLVVFEQWLRQALSGQSDRAHE